MKIKHGLIAAALTVCSVALSATPAMGSVFGRLYTRIDEQEWVLRLLVCSTGSRWRWTR